MKTNITTKSDRAKLEPRREPYWKALKIGGYVGYRKLENGNGTWIARWRDEAGKQKYRALGEFDAYDEAAKVAGKWLAQNETGTSTKATTVEQVCRAYVDHIKIEKSPDTAKDADLRFNRLVYGTPLAKKPIDKVRYTDIQKWVNSQLDHVDLDDDDDTIRAAKCSANRNLASFKAALNFAVKSHLVGSGSAWDTITPFKDANKRRERFLSLDERQSLLGACREDLRLFVESLLLTGARPGEIAALTVKDFDRGQGTLSFPDGKTGRRIVSLSSAALAFFTQASKDKIGNAPLLARQDGLPWQKDYWKDLFKAAVINAGLPDDVVLYTLRHTAISEMISSGIDSFIVARLAGTSTAMIDKHYGHLKHNITRAKLDNAQMI
jgi:integrase